MPYRLETLEEENYLQAGLLGKGQVVALGADASWESVRPYGAIEARAGWSQDTTALTFAYVEPVSVMLSTSTRC